MPAEKQQNSVLIISGSDKVIEFFTELLPVSAFTPIITASSAGEARRLLITNSYDLVIINTPLPDEFGSELSLEISLQAYSGVLLLVKSDLFDQISYKVEEYGVLTVVKPNSKQGIYQAVKLLVATRERLRGSEKKNATLQAKMDEIRLINRAKWMLIEHLNMKEAVAHRYIEKQAMDMRITRKEVAENILKTYGS